MIAPCPRAAKLSFRPISTGYRASRDQRSSRAADPRDLSREEREKTKSRRSLTVHRLAKRFLSVARVAENLKRRPDVANVQAGRGYKAEGFIDPSGTFDKISRDILASRRGLDRRSRDSPTRPVVGYRCSSRNKIARCKSALLLAGSFGEYSTAAGETSIGRTNSLQLPRGK